MTEPWVLVVDDDCDNLDVMVETLNLAGFAVRGVRSAEEALSHLDGTDKPCAVLCDYMMPGLSGLEFLKQVRTDAALDDVKIAFMTAQIPMLVPFPKDVAVLPKPFGDTDLIAFVDSNCLGAHRHAGETH